MQHRCVLQLQKCLLLLVVVVIVPEGLDMGLGIQKSVHRGAFNSGEKF